MSENDKHDTELKMSDTASLPSTGYLPLTRIGPVALECAEQIESAFGEDAKVLSVVVVAEVLAPTLDGEYVDSIEFASNERRRWVQLAMLNEAVAKAEQLNEARVEAVEDALEAREDNE